MAAPPIDRSLAALVESGSAHIVGLVTADGEPFVTRGWGAWLDLDRAAVRLLLGATEVTACRADGLVGAPIAFTCTDVRSLVSAQMKGIVERVEPATADDLVTFATYCDGYYDAVMDVDFVARALMERMQPDEVVACTFVVEEVYDQTPGPGAGRVYGAPS